MSRFDDFCEDEGIPWELWERSVSTALGSGRGQKMLAEIEAALLALPEPRLIEGKLADEGHVCTVGAFVAHRRAKLDGTDTATVIREMCEEDYYGIHETADAGEHYGLGHAVAWHMAWLNDEKFGGLSPEGRYETMLAWVRRAQGEPEASCV